LKKSEKKFQFYISTIKGIAICFFTSSSSIFQFYISTIKGQDHHQKHDCILYFNSTLVRLKAFNMLINVSLSIIFQFYISTIKGRNNQFI